MYKTDPKGLTYGKHLCHGLTLLPSPLLNVKAYWTPTSVTTERDFGRYLNSVVKSLIFPIPCQRASAKGYRHHLARSQALSVFNTKDHPDPTPAEPVPLDHALCNVSFTTEDVSEAQLAPDPNKATGPDGIPCRLLKETARQIAPSLTQLFNLPLCCGTLPGFIHVRRCAIDVQSS